MLSFNSLMVRLKEYEYRLGDGDVMLFQFLDGAIKRSPVTILQAYIYKFQFLDGAIKSYATATW